ncbi:phage holin family protein [Solicola gregarius]|uniref:Phage holin family protein n=1 Tax=Solicola gregarius TaxID=2908642 RepID=A0AA46YNR9_9ACTN|nr:phage holin family protein [Solicola gregarius]UYM07766.1 phage holin family protein [Solicola gregarius]
MSSQGQHRLEAQEQSDPTIGRLVADASRDVSSLVQYEIQLAKSELRVSVKNLGIGGALLAVAGFFGIMIIIFASITAAYFIAKIPGLDLAWAFLIVTGIYLLLAVILVLIGIRKLKAIKAPEQTISTAKEIPGALKGQHDKAGARPEAIAPKP